LEEHDMLAIVISVCLVGDPSVCRDERMPQLIEASPRQCPISAVPFVAQWTSEHPDWRVVRWRCSRPDEKDI